MKKSYFRALTNLHLFQCLLLVEQSGDNEIYLQGKFDGLDINELKKVFGKVHFSSNYNVRKFEYLIFVLKYFFRKKKRKSNVFFCSFHNHDSLTIKEYINSKELNIINDGNFSLEPKVRGEINYFNYNGFHWKSFFSYFLNAKQRKVQDIYFFDFQDLHSSKLKLNNFLKLKKKELDFHQIMSEKKRFQMILKVFNVLENDVLPNNKKKSLLITQPLVERGLLSMDKQISILSSQIDSCKFQIYLKQHPSEKKSKYDRLISNNKIIFLPKNLPFEVLDFFGWEFEEAYSTTYSTISNLKSIKKFEVFDEKLLV